MNIWAAVLFFAATLLTGACSSMRTGADYDPTVDLSRYRTYQWVTEAVMNTANEEPRISPLVQQRIRDAVDQSLGARGLKKAEPADMVVSSTISVRDDVRITSWGPYGGYYRGYPRSYGYGLGWGTPAFIDTQPSGVLVVNMFDAKTKRPIWHGWASRVLESGDTGPEAINKTVDAILAQFPYGPPG